MLNPVRFARGTALMFAHRNAAAVVGLAACVPAGPAPNQRCSVRNALRRAAIRAALPRRGISDTLLW